MRLFLLSLVVGVAVLGSSCSVFDSTCKEEDGDCLTNPLLASGVGGACTRTGECKSGLKCVDGECAATGDAETGDDCRLTAECGDDDYCGSKRVCQVAGIASENSRCTTTGNCEHGLVCEPPDLSQQGAVTLADLAQVSGLCQEGGKQEQGESCKGVTDCLAGLTCIPESVVCKVTMACGDREVPADSKICTALPESPNELPALPALWDGLDCPKVDEDDAAEAYFKVPRDGDDDPTEFYSLPFPNDIRRTGGHVDMASHPAPPEDIGVPLVNRYVEVSGADLDGFSLNPVVFFRFSQPYDFGSVKSETLKLLDITDKSQPEYDKLLGVEWKTTSGDLSNYICPHWLALKPPPGSPLKPGRTYAAIVTTGVVPKAGGSFKRGADLSALLSDSAPSDGDLTAAHAAYEPLRKWMADTNQQADQILTAAVFTTAEPEATIPALRAQVQADPIATLSDLTICESDKTKSPCESEETEKDKDGKEMMVTRGACPATQAAYSVIHGHIRLPVFQKGTAPYLEPKDGGEIEVDGSGVPKIQGHQDVCFALSVPNAATPANGYPVLVYGHGTGGSFTGEMGSGGLAGPLATATVPAALIAIDLPEHGSRRGDSKKEPEGLFYNFLNPRAARDNVLQGSADLMAVIRWVKSGGGLKSGAPLSKAVAFDATRIALMGHSQGSTHSALLEPYEPDVIGVVLSGNGGNLAASLLHKTSPVDIASVVPLGLMDPDSNFKLAGGDFNPALALIQWVFDRSDPVNFAPHVIRSPTTEVPTSHHLFMTYGLGDTYAPEETQRAYIRAAGRQMPLVGPMMADLRLEGETQEWPVLSPPVQGNTTVGGEARTIAVRQYTPSSKDIDGHFVGTRSGEDGRADVERFLEGLLAGQTPTIGQ